MKELSGRLYFVYQSTGKHTISIQIEDSAKGIELIQGINRMYIESDAIEQMINELKSIRKIITPPHS